MTESIFDLHNLRNRIRNGEFDDDVFEKQNQINYLRIRGIQV